MPRIAEQRKRCRPTWVLALACAANADAQGAPLQQPRLRDSIEVAIDRIEARGATAGRVSVVVGSKDGLRYQESIDVSAPHPNPISARFLASRDALYGPQPQRAPTHKDLERYRQTPTGPNFLPLLSWLGHKILASGEPRFFLYRIVREDRSFSLMREGPLPAQLIAAGARGVRFELLASYASRSDAVAAYRQLESGGPVRPATEHRFGEALLHALQPVATSR